MNIGLGAKRRTILLVDADPHARATLRTALERAGFTVGEAADRHEGERTALRVHPDAVLADLPHDALDAGGRIAARLKEGGRHVPVYIVSSVVDALVGSVGLDALGVSGVFCKPIDPTVIIQTLKTRLGA